MDDALLMRVFERVDELLNDGQGTFEREWAGERFAFDELHNQGSIFDAVDCRDVGMIQGCEYVGFTFESRHAVRVLREGVRKNFVGDVAMEFSVGGAPDFAHAALAELAGDAIVSDGLLRRHRASGVGAIIYRRSASLWRGMRRLNDLYAVSDTPDSSHSEGIE